MQKLKDEFPKHELSPPHQKLGDVLAEISARSPADRSLIIAINGPWGSGKSTLLHLLFHEAKQLGIPPKHLVHFNAWKVESGDLTHEFFSELGRGLGIVADPQTIESLSRYADILSGAGKLAEKLLNAATRVTTVLALVGIGLMTFVELQSWKLFLLVTAVTVYLAGPLLFGTAWMLRMTQRLLVRWHRQRNSEAKLKQRVSEKLMAIDAPLIVAIDDIDRVTSERAREIISLVHNNARFGNLTYVLLMDQQNVAGTVGMGDVDAGKEFLEKLVDVQVSLQDIHRKRVP